MTERNTREFFLYFARAYPIRSAVMIALLLGAGLAEGVGIAGLLPVLEIGATQSGAEPSGLSRTVSNLLGRVGLRPTLSILLFIVVGAMALKGLFRWLAMRQVGYVVARVAMDLRLGSLCEPLGADPVDLFLANLPHKPSVGADRLPLAQDGGPEGDRLFSAALPAMARHQQRGGRLLFSLHSLPHPRLLRCAQRFYTLDLVRWKLRWLGSASYGGLRPGFRERHAVGTSFLVMAEEGEAFITGVWVCRRRGRDG